MFHMGWFLGYGFGVYGWNKQWAGNVGKDVARPGLFVDMATSLERAGFDYMMLEDSSVLPDVYEGSFRHSLKTGVVRHDPMPLIPLLGAATRAGHHRDRLHQLLPAVPRRPPVPHPRPPHRGPGRSQPGHLQPARRSPELRPRQALRARPALQDGRRVDDPGRPAVGLLGPRRRHPRRGQRILRRPRQSPARQLRRRVLPVPRPAQHRPEPPAAARHLPGRRLSAGRELAARHADTIIAAVQGVEAMKEYRDDISARMIAHGRKPTDAKVLFLVEPILGETDQRGHDPPPAPARRGHRQHRRPARRLLLPQRLRLLQVRPRHPPGRPHRQIQRPPRAPSPTS